MVIEVSYQSSRDAKDPHSAFRETKYFEIGKMPDRKMVAEKLNTMGVDFDQGSIAVKACEDESETMRKAGFSVPKF